MKGERGKGMSREEVVHLRRRFRREKERVGMVMLKSSRSRESEKMRPISL